MLWLILGLVQACSCVFQVVSYVLPLDVVNCVYNNTCFFFLEIYKKEFGKSTLRLNHPNSCV